VPNLMSPFHWVEDIYNSMSLGEMLLIIVPTSMVITLIYLLTSSVFRTFLYRFSNRG